MRAGGSGSIQVPAGLAVAVAAAVAIVLVAASYSLARTSATQRPKCFGAAARDPVHRCRNRRLDHTVIPKPVNALLQPNAPCSVIELTDVLYVCQFGRRARAAIGTVALVGDSHASHWRAGLEVMARRRRWRGVSITQDACPLSKANLVIVKRKRKPCLDWRKATFEWFEDHPEVSIVFVSGHTGVKAAVRDGEDAFEAQVSGFLEAWRALPASVRRIVVIRDTPRTATGTHACVERAIRRRERAGTRCAVSRRRYLARDPAAVAARRLSSDRVEVIDMSRYFCGRRLCYPVIGGALVHKDVGHITRVYSATLGPYLLREYRRLPGSGEKARRTRRS